MEKLKKVFLVLLMMILASVSLFADDDDNTAWWVGMEISGFEYTGLINVRESTVDQVLSSYIGESYSDELFMRMFNALYSQPWLEYVSAEALRGGSTGASLVIRFNIVERPMISSISIEGNDRISNRTIMDQQHYSVGSFIGANDYSVNANLIRDYYYSQGYRDAQVECTSTFDGDRNTESIVYNITEGAQYKIRAIVFENATVFNSRDLLRQMTSRARSFFNSGNFVQSTLDADLTALITFYNQSGYNNARINNVSITDSTEEGDTYRFVTITIDIAEGNQYFVGDVEIEGNNIFSTDEIMASLNLYTDDVNSTKALEDGMLALYSLYQNRGYSHANINYNISVDEESHRVNYAFSIIEGRQSVIEEIRIEGLTKTQPRVFERELTIHVGDLFNRDAIIRSQQNIMNTGLVRNIRLGILNGSTEEGVILIFDIEEGNQMELQFGATFGGSVDDFPISGFLSWTDRNLFGTGRNLGISTTLSPTTQSISLSFTDNWVGDQRWSNGVSLSFEHSSRRSVLQRGISSDYYDGWDRYKQTYPLGYGSADEWYASNKDYPSVGYLMQYEFYRIALGYNTSYTWQFAAGNLTIGGGVSLGLNHADYDPSKYDPYEELVREYHDGWRFSNYLSFNLQWDGRDLVRNTTRGYVLNFSFRYAGGFLGGLSNYNRLQVNASAFQSLFHTTNEEGRESHLVLSGTMGVSFMLPQFWNRSGHGWNWYDAGFGATDYEMLYIDGMNIGRGFDSVTHLSFLWNNQVELSYPIVLDILNVEAFFSATAVTYTLDELSSWNNIDWYFAMGAGVRLSIPGFPLGLYIVKNATVIDGNFTWDNNGVLFGGLKLVLAISTSIY